ncbi:MAG: TolC family protein, partial [Caulobacteraceae bacterium]
LLQEARAGRYPSTDPSAGATYGRPSAALAVGAPAGWTLAAGFAASYQVDIFGRIRRSIQSANANVQATAAAEDVVRVSVAAAVASAYANICGFGEQIDVARRSETLLARTYDIDVRQRAAGALSDFDIARQAVLLDQARAAIPPLEGQRRSTLFALAALTGLTPAEVPAAAAACRRPPTLRQLLPVGDGAGLLRRRPDIREAERTLAANTYRIGVAAADLYPTVSLGGSVSSAAPALGQLFSPSTTSYGVGPLISWSFPNIAVARAHVRETTAQAASAEASFQATMLQALQETEQALATYAAELEHHRQLASASAAAGTALRLALLQYRAGVASGLDLITAQSAAVGADQALAASDQALSADQVAVFQALGGGWEDAPAVAVPTIR